MIAPPTAPSPSRWLRFAMQDRTLLRALEDEQIDGKVLKGATLDIGGGAGFGYVERLRIEGRLDSINIAAEVRPTIVSDLNRPLPVPSASYDNIICFNTLEHVLDERALLAEAFRVLKDDGRFVITVPFLFRRHGNYGDFHRHTAEYWEATLVAAGLPSQSFRILPLIWTPFSSALATLPWFRGGMRGRLAKLVVLGIGLIGRPAAYAADYALGYCIEGVKTRSAV